MKKVLIISYYAGKSTAVGARRINAMHDFLIANNYSSKVISLNNSEDIINLNRKNFNKTSLLTSVSTYFRSLDKTSFSFSILRIIKSHFKSKDKIDFIIASYKPSWSLIIGIVLSKIYNAKLLFEYRDLASLFGRKKRIFFIHQIDVLIDKILLSFADRLIVVSPTQKKN